MLASLAAIAIAYLVGSVPVAYLAGRVTSGIDLREHGSGNVGASNVGESISRRLMIVVGVVQIAQGLVAVLVARAFDAGDGVQAACGVAAVLANDWNPWLRFAGGRGIGTTIGVLLALSPWALGAFVVIAVAGAVVRMVPQGMALALIATPIAAAVAGDGSAIIVCCALLAALALTKRVLANGAPDASAPRPDVWMWRMLLDRDVRDRDAWVRRGSDRSPRRRGNAEPDL
jgi:glycerol-3-phosphate acyltransferase PlsY